MADVALKDMLNALTGKIKALSTGTATAEDTALMGFAIDKIAGQVGALELQLLSDQLQAALTALAQTKVAETNKAGIDNLAAVAARVTTILNTATQAESDYNTNAANKTTGFNTNATNRTSAFDNNAQSKMTIFNTNATAKTGEVNTAGADQVAKVKEATGAAIATPTIVEGAIIYNRRGFVTRWVSETGKIYSEITYDSRDRITGWLETYTNGAGTIVRFRYAATYQVGTANIKNITRTAA